MPRKPMSEEARQALSEKAKARWATRDVAPTGAPVNVADIASIVADAIGAATDGLQAEIQALKDERLRIAPSFKPMVAADNSNLDERKRAFAKVNIGDQREADGRRTLPSTMAGQIIPEQALRYFPQRYHQGTTVRIRRNVQREGFPDGVTWGDVLDKIECEGVGVIKSCLPMGKTGQWKYKCEFKGLTPGIRGDGFYQYELEPLAA